MPAAPLKALVNSKERLYYALLVLTSLAIYAGLAAAVAASVEGAGIAAVYVLPISLALFMAHGLLIGRLRGNAVRVSARQFPTLYRLVARHAATLGIKTVPDIFVMESGGVLNAFATRFLGRDFVVIYSDVLALADERGEAALGFVVAHELAHVWRGHLKHRWLTLPGRFVPYLGAAYSRACEYTCDRVGAHCQPDGAVDGLLVLAAGKDLFRQVDAREYARQAEAEQGFFVRRAELMSSHPNLTKRVAALLRHGVSAPAYSPMLSGAGRPAAAPHPA
ncbi:MAG TPA: M48 family metallopeptidase [Gemmatimonadaceae bacterium]|nr:M48 family metallopeptidase [Gemmatimonadaceae bacterium]